MLGPPQRHEQGAVMNKLCCTLAFCLLLSACNTINGMGRDLQKGGEKVQEAAQSVQKKM